jgi:predicted transcriptional regulator
MKAAEIMTRDVISLDENTVITEALAKMRDNSVQTVPILRDGKYIGVLTYREILKRHSIRPNSKVVHFATPSPGLAEDDSIEAIAKSLVDSGMMALPVIKKEKIVGIVSRTDLVKHLSEIYNIKSLKCENLMIPEKQFVHEKDGVDIAVEAMRSMDLTEFPLVDDKGRYTGIMKLNDATRELFGKEDGIKFGQYTSSKQRVKIVCSSLLSELPSLRKDDALEKAATLMVENLVHIAPITDDDNKLVGIVEMNTIVNTIAGTSEGEGVLVNISGLEPGEEDLYEITYFMADKFMTRFHKLTGHNYGQLNINVQKYKTQGKTKYSVRTRLFSGRISMSMDSHNWNFGRCISDIFDGYEKRLAKIKEKA